MIICELNGPDYHTGQIVRMNLRLGDMTVARDHPFRIIREAEFDEYKKYYQDRGAKTTLWCNHPNVRFWEVSTD